MYGSQWKALSHLAKEYSTEVLGLKLGSDLVVVVYGDRNIRQVFIDSEFEGRPDSFFIKLRCFGKRMGKLLFFNNIEDTGRSSLWIFYDFQDIGTCQTGFEKGLLLGFI